MERTYSTIRFNLLEDCVDPTRFIVLAGYIIEEEDLQDIENFFTEVKLIEKGRRLIGAYRILDNVKGDEGRQDWFLEFEKSEHIFNPAVRMHLRANGIPVMWVDDFIGNYKQDYK